MWLEHMQEHIFINKTTTTQPQTHRKTITEGVGQNCIDWLQKNFLCNCGRIVCTIAEIDCLEQSNVCVWLLRAIIEGAFQLLQSSIAQKVFALERKQKGLQRQVIN